jgi:hypothetical protein
MGILEYISKVDNLVRTLHTVLGNTPIVFDLK